MGGYTLDSTGEGNPILPSGKERMRLTLKGICIALQVRPELRDHLLLNDDLDKSKASPVTKAIVCCQALWFILECIGRVAQSLPVSLLEVSSLHFISINESL